MFFNTLALAARGIVDPTRDLNIIDIITNL